MADNFNRLIKVEEHVHMFGLEAPFFSSEDFSAASFVALCCSMVAVRLVTLHVKAAEALSPLQGVSLHLLTSSSCCCCLVRHRDTHRAQIEPL